MQLISSPTHVPFNTLLITLSTGETFYVPSRSLQSAPPSRAPSPDAGYSSDPELDVFRARGPAEFGLRTPRLDASFDSMPTSPAVSDFDGPHSRRKRAVKSATYQDLLKYVAPAEKRLATLTLWN